MRRSYRFFAAALLSALLAFLLLPAAPALAYTSYGQLYDSTDRLDKSRCESMGQQLADLSEEVQIDLHVDVVEDLEGRDIDEYAKVFYTQYQYGNETTGDGILLMIYLTEDGEGLAYQDHDIIFGGQNKETIRETVYAMVKEIAPYLNEDAFKGGLQEDNDAFFHAMEKVISVVKGETAQMAETETETEAAAAAADGLLPLDQIESGSLVWNQLEGTYVKDAAGLLSAQEKETLESKAQELAGRYGVGVYVLSVDDYRSYGGDSNIEMWTEKLYLDNGLGLGSAQNGVILVLSMAERDYCLKIYGEDALFAYTDYAQGLLTERFLGSFKNNDWYGGFSRYMDFGGEILEDAADGSPMEKYVNWTGVIGASSLVSLIIGLFGGSGRVKRLRRTMKNTGIRKSAWQYVSRKEGVHFHSKRDHYVNTSVNRVRIHRDDDRSSGGGHGGGGGTTVNSHGFSGGSGKF